MAKLTKKQRAELREALATLERAARFIAQADIAFCRVREIGTDKTGKPYPASHHGWQSAMVPGKELIGPMVKEAGSELVLISTAVDSLAAFIVRN